METPYEPLRKKRRLETTSTIFAGIFLFCNNTRYKKKLDNEPLCSTNAITHLKTTNDETVQSHDDEKVEETCDSFPSLTDETRHWIRRQTPLCIMLTRAAIGAWFQHVPFQMVYLDTRVPIQCFHVALEKTCLHRGGVFVCFAPCYYTTVKSQQQQQQQQQPSFVVCKQWIKWKDNDTADDTPLPHEDVCVLESNHSVYTWKDVLDLIRQTYVSCPELLLPLAQHVPHMISTIQTMAGVSYPTIIHTILLWMFMHGVNTFKRMPPIHNLAFVKECVSPTLLGIIMSDRSVLFFDPRDEAHQEQFLMQQVIHFHQQVAQFQFSEETIRELDQVASLATVVQLLFTANLHVVNRPWFNTWMMQTNNNKPCFALVECSNDDDMMQDEKSANNTDNTNDLKKPVAITALNLSHLDQINAVKIGFAQDAVFAHQLDRSSIKHLVASLPSVKRCRVATTHLFNMTLEQLYSWVKHVWCQQNPLFTSCEAVLWSDQCIEFLS